MDILLLYTIDYNKAFCVDHHNNLIVDDVQIHAVKHFMNKWGFMIHLIVGVDETLTQHRFGSDNDNRTEMYRLYNMGHELKRRMKQIQYQTNLKT